MPTSAPFDHLSVILCFQPLIYSTKRFTYVPESAIVLGDHEMAVQATSLYLDVTTELLSSRKTNSQRSGKDR